jgi:phosphatidylinositol glycan class O
MLSAAFINYCSCFIFFKLIFVFQLRADQVVSQTDIVPTLSLLLGLPIPFSNLGIIIPSLFENSGLQDFPENTSLLHALQLNARQVNRYITEYTQLSNDISSDVLDTITSPLFKRKAGFSRDKNNHTINYDILQGETAYLTYLKKTRELCRTVWAKFDLLAIQSGIFIVTLLSVISLIIIWILVPKLFLDKHRSQKLYKYGMLAVLIILFPGFLLFHGNVWLFVLVFLLYGIAGFVLKLHTNIFGYMKQNFADVNFKSVVMVFLLFIQFAGFFSNSYVINEDKILVFFLQTIIVVLALNILTSTVASVKFLEFENSKCYIKTQKRKDTKKRGVIRSVLGQIKHELACLFLLMVLFRLGSLFWPCREEQAACESTEFFTGSEQNGYQFWMGSVFLLLVPASLLFRLRASGNLNGYSSPVLAVKYALPFGAVFACVHWLLQYVPAKMVEQNPAIGYLQQIVTPCILYCSCLGSLCCLLYQPITAFVVRPRDVKDEPAILTGQRSMRNAVVRIFKQLRSELSEADNNDDVTYVYGLGTVYSSAVLILLVCFALPMALVLGEGLGPSVVSMLAQMYLFLELDRMMTSQEAVDVQIPLGM